MNTVQRERRYVCGQTKQNAIYQEVEIYTVGTDKKGREREKEKSTPIPFRGKNPEKWDGHNAFPEMVLPPAGYQLHRAGHTYQFDLYR